MSLRLCPRLWLLLLSLPCSAALHESARPLRGRLAKVLAGTSAVAEVDSSKLARDEPGEDASAEPGAIDWDVELLQIQIEDELKPKAGAAGQGQGQAGARSEHKHEGKGKAESEHKGKAGAKGQQKGKALGELARTEKAQSAGQHNGKAATKAHLQPKADSEARHKVRAEAKSQHEAKTEAKNQHKAKAEAEAVTEHKQLQKHKMQAKASGQHKGKADAKVQHKAKTDSEAQHEATAESKSQREAKGEAKNQRKAKAEAVAEHKQVKKGNAKAEANGKHKGKAKAEADSEHEAKAEAKGKHKVKAETVAEGKQVQKQKGKADAKGKHKAKAEQERQHKVKAAGESQHEAKAEAEVQHKAEAESKSQHKGKAEAQNQHEEGKAASEVQNQAEAEGEAQEKEQAETENQHEETSADQMTKTEAEAQVEEETKSQQMAESDAVAEHKQIQKEEAVAEAKGQGTAEAELEDQQEGKAASEVQNQAEAEREAQEKEQAESGSHHEVETVAEQSTKAADLQLQHEANVDTEGQHHAEDEAEVQRQAAAPEQQAEEEPAVDDDPEIEAQTADQKLAKAGALPEADAAGRMSHDGPEHLGEPDPAEHGQRPKAPLLALSDSREGSDDPGPDDGSRRLAGRRAEATADWVPNWVRTKDMEAMALKRRRAPSTEEPAEAENKTDSRLQNMPASPEAPGCYVWAPTGCPNHLSFVASTWQHDNFGEEFGGAKQNRTVCEEMRGPHFKQWCGAGDVKMIWIAEDVGLQQPEASMLLNQEAPENSGCYVQLPNGCPRHPTFKADQWTIDPSWEIYEETATKKSCDQRGPKFAHWCGTLEGQVNMLFVQPSEPRELAQQRSRPSSAVPAAPSEPGCYSFVPFGCPSHPQRTSASWKAENYPKASESQEVCESRELPLAKWCGTTEVKMLFVRDVLAEESAQEEQSEQDKYGSPAEEPSEEPSDAGLPAEPDGLMPAAVEAAHPEVPSEPGCYVFTPQGCPRSEQFQRDSTRRWVRDTYGEKHLRAGTDRAVCEGRGESHYASWCGTSAVELVFVPGMVEPSLHAEGERGPPEAPGELWAPEAPAARRAAPAGSRLAQRLAERMRLGGAHQVVDETEDEAALREADEADAMGTTTEAAPADTIRAAAAMLRQPPGLPKIGDLEEGPPPGKASGLEDVPPKVPEADPGAPKATPGAQDLGTGPGAPKDLAPWGAPQVGAPKDAGAPQVGGQGPEAPAPKDLEAEAPAPKDLEAGQGAPKDAGASQVGGAPEDPDAKDLWEAKNAHFTEKENKEEYKRIRAARAARDGQQHSVAWDPEMNVMLLSLPIWILGCIGISELRRVWQLKPAPKR